MPKPICLSPLNFYDDPAKQSHRKSYAHGHISPLIVATQSLPPFQFVIPDELYTDGDTLGSAYFVDINTESIVGDNKVQLLHETGFRIIEREGYKVALYPGYLPLQIEKEGRYYLKLSSASGAWTYYSEVFCFTNATSDCIEIEYWNATGDFKLRDGIIAFPEGFHFKLLLRSEIGKPEYEFEEEATKRGGYNFIEHQISKKVYKFNAVVPEFICDAMRIIRLCDNKIIRCKGEEYDALTFEMQAEWQVQGDLASVNCEFETDNVIANLGGFRHEGIGGDFNPDFNSDFDNT